MDSSIGIKPIEKHHHHQQNQQQKQLQQSCVASNDNNNKPKHGADIRDLEIFFKNGLHNSCQAIDELMKEIENSQDENLARRALELYQRHYSSLERPWDHVNFMYGLGLIYMHFSAYNWAIKSFREAIYVQPNFSRSRDIHTRLGLIFKATGRYKMSEKHFKLAINDTRPNCGSSTMLELKFHLANLYELQGKWKQASDSYERLLQEKDLPSKLSANIQRQLGCIHYATSSKDSLIDQNNQQQITRTRKDNIFNLQQQNTTDIQKIDAALNYLNASYRTDNDSNTSYYLGRCLTNIGRFQDAFASYRSVIDREESTADTWCSIGVLYHRQNQPWDALQAYIRSVQFDKKHSVAWMNLGILYESHNQFQDALKCYKHVLRSSPDAVDRSLQVRIKYIQKQLVDIEQTSSSNNGKFKTNPDKLLSLEDLWNLESKTNSEPPSSTSNIGSKSISIAHTIMSSNPTRAPDNFTNNTSTTSSNTNHQLFPGESPIETNTKHQNSLINGVKISDHKVVVGIASPNNHMVESNSSLTCEIDSKSETESNHLNNHNGLLDDCKLELKSHVNQEFNPQSVDAKDLNLNHALTNGASKDSGISSNSSTYTDCALVPSQNLDIRLSNPPTSDQVILATKNMPKPRKIDINLSSDCERPPSMFTDFPSYPPPTQEKLCPQYPSIFIETKKELASKKLQDICQSSPISIVRNIATVLKLDLGLFSTKTLVESNPNQQINIISHINSQSSNESPDEEPNNLWSCERQKSFSTISRYANYQVASFRESLQDELDGKLKPNPMKEFETDSNESGGTNARKHSNMNSDCQGPSFSYLNSETHQNSNSKSGPVAKKLKKDHHIKMKLVRSAEMIDLSDEKKWRSQLNELNKLPHFMRCVSASNMLTHIGTSVPGVNTTVMNMHVPGCRIMGNRTPDNFCPVNINTGPGDYEWFAISRHYEQDLLRLCNRNGFQFDEKDWWPKISDLHKYRIPVYRFSQRPGDLVWVNSGTIYWVQALGWANSIQWNVGPLSARQYKLASEKIEINKLIFRKSKVPMVQMTWNMAMNINIIADDELFRSFVDVLRRSIRYCWWIKELLDDSKKEIKASNEEPGPKCAQFCSLCEVEIFNIIFTRQRDGSLHCVECARRSDESLSFGEYDIKQNYDLSYLMKLYDSFLETRKKFQARQEQIKQHQ